MDLRVVSPHNINSFNSQWEEFCPPLCQGSNMLSIAVSYIIHEIFRPVYVCMFVTLRLPPLNSETKWTGDFWLKTVFLK